MLLSKLRGFISYFQITVSILATNYVHLRNERSNNGDDEYTYDSAIRSVLAEFDLGTVYENYLFTQVKMLRTKSRNSIAGSDFDFSLYENGFRYYSFENSPDYDFKSIISMFSFSQTPERILTKLAKRQRLSECRRLQHYRLCCVITTSITCRIKWALRIRIFRRTTVNA